MARTHIRNPEAEAELKSVKECCLLTCSSLLARVAFLYNLWHFHSGLGSLKSMINQENAHRIS